MSERTEAEPTMGLPDVGPALAALIGRPVPYATVYQAVLSGKITKVRRVRGRYRIAHVDIPAVAVELDLVVLADREAA